MAQLTFYCPYTNEPLPSGIEIDPQSAETVAVFPINVFCPHCDCFHHGVIADGTITPPGPGTRKPGKKTA